MDDLMKGKVLFITPCPLCGREGMKQNMFTMSVKKRRDGIFRTLCHICPDCMPKLLDFLAVSMPE